MKNQNSLYFFLRIQSNSEHISLNDIICRKSLIILIRKNTSINLVWHDIDVNIIQSNFPYMMYLCTHQGIMVTMIYVYIDFTRGRWSEDGCLRTITDMLGLRGRVTDPTELHTVIVPVTDILTPAKRAHDWRLSYHNITFMFFFEFSPRLTAI